MSNPNIQFAGEQPGTAAPGSPPLSSMPVPQRPTSTMSYTQLSQLLGERDKLITKLQGRLAEQERFKHQGSAMDMSDDTAMNSGGGNGEDSREYQALLRKYKVLQSTSKMNNAELENLRAMQSRSGQDYSALQAQITELEVKLAEAGEDLDAKTLEFEILEDSVQRGNMDFPMGNAQDTTRSELRTLKKIVANLTQGFNITKQHRDTPGSLFQETQAYVVRQASNASNDGMSSEQMLAAEAQYKTLEAERDRLKSQLEMQQPGETWLQKELADAKAQIEHQSKVQDRRAKESVKKDELLERHEKSIAFLKKRLDKEVGHRAQEQRDMAQERQQLKQQLNEARGPKQDGGEVEQLKREIEVLHQQKKTMAREVDVTEAKYQKAQEAAQGQSQASDLMERDDFDNQQLTAKVAKMEHNEIEFRNRYQEMLNERKLVREENQRLVAVNEQLQQQIAGMQVQSEAEKQQARAALDQLTKEAKDRLNTADTALVTSEQEKTSIQQQLQAVMQEKMSLQQQLQAKTSPQQQLETAVQEKTTLQQQLETALQEKTTLQQQLDAAVQKAKQAQTTAEQQQRKFSQDAKAAAEQQYKTAVQEAQATVEQQRQKITQDAQAKAQQQYEKDLHEAQAEAAQQKETALQEAQATAEQQKQAAVQEVKVKAKRYHKKLMAEVEEKHATIVANSQATLESLEAKIVDLTATNEQQASTIAKLETREKALLAEGNKLFEDHRELQEKYRSINQGSQQKNPIVKDILTENQTMRGEIHQLESEKKDRETAIAASLRDRQALEVKLASLTQQHAVASATLQAQHATEITAAQAALEDLQKQVSVLTADKQKQQSTIQSLSSECSSLERAAEERTKEHVAALEAAETTTPAKQQPDSARDDARDSREQAAVKTPEAGKGKLNKNKSKAELLTSLTAADKATQDAKADCTKQHKALVDAHDAELKELRAKHEDLTGKFRNTLNDLVRAKKQLEEVEPRAQRMSKEHTQEKIRLAADAASEAKYLRSQLEKQKAAWETDRQRQLARYDELAARLDRVPSIDPIIAAAQKDMEAAHALQLATQEEDCHAEQFRLQETIRGLRRTITEHEQRLAQDQADMDVMDQELDTAKSRIDQLELELRTAAADVDLARRRIGDLEAEVEQLQVHADTAAEELAEALGLLSTNTDPLRRTESRESRSLQAEREEAAAREEMAEDALRLWTRRSLGRTVDAATQTTATTTTTRATADKATMASEEEALGENIEIEMVIEPGPHGPPDHHGDHNTRPRTTSRSWIRRFLWYLLVLGALSQLVPFVVDVTELHENATGLRREVYLLPGTRGYGMPYILRTSGIEGILGRIFWVLAT